MIQLGDTVKDTVSGFKGVAVGRSEWLNGCVRYIVQPPADKEGKLPVPESFDEPQLTVVKVVKRVTAVPKDTGGPFPTPSRGQTVSR